MSRISKTGQEQRSVEGSTPLKARPTRRKSMFRSRRQLAAAAGVWVLLVAASIGVSAVPGATAAKTPPSTGTTLQQQVTHTVYAATRATKKKPRRRPRRGYVKTLNSLNSSCYDQGRGGLCSASDNCTLTRAELGDLFTMNDGGPLPERCTWVNWDFSHMHRHEV